MTRAPGAEREVDPRAVAARHAAAGVDDNRLALGAGARKAQPEAAGLEQAGGLGAGAGAREARANLAARALPLAGGGKVLVETIDPRVHGAESGDAGAS